ncbi:L-xylulose reductase-like [Oppia nitens]|uniref:L-xylulose reductase-like n=1 Tax=Oppia nitens TaxID=1686743 RepID=UPI0023DC3609|nr:L-xylulose reductase-like [Oppia nitens]
MSKTVFNFSDKVVLITGSSSGMGAVTAIEFARAGARVVITGRNAENLAKVAKDCQQVSPTGLTPLVVVADINKEDDCRRLVAETITAYKQLDILVNNAGFAIRSQITNTDILDIYDKVLNTNLKAVIYLCHLCVEHLEKTKGNIINISSVAGIKPLVGNLLYCTAKSALDMFSKCLAIELGPKGIRVNIINPALVRTNFHRVADHLTAQQADEFYDKYGEKYPIGRVGESIDIANAVLFLSSNEASFVTGINFVSDGGSLNAL